MTTTREITLEVSGMTCGSCVRHVTEALAALDGVAQVDVRLEDGTVRVRDDGHTPIEALTGALEDAGYPARPAGI